MGKGGIETRGPRDDVDKGFGELHLLLFASAGRFEEFAGRVAAVFVHGDIEKAGAFATDDPDADLLAHRGVRDDAAHRANCVDIVFVGVIHFGVALGDYEDEVIGFLLGLFDRDDRKRTGDFDLFGHIGEDDKGSCHQ